jgi:hypothetical protein
MWSGSISTPARSGTPPTRPGSRRSRERPPTPSGGTSRRLDRRAETTTHGSIVSEPRAPGPVAELPQYARILP